MEGSNFAFFYFIVGFVKGEVVGGGSCDCLQSWIDILLEWEEGCFLFVVESYINICKSYKLN